jgi:hypothetical protein
LCGREDTGSLVPTAEDVFAVWDAIYLVGRTLVKEGMTKKQKKDGTNYKIFTDGQNRRNSRKGLRGEKDFSNL